jgi:hypothetical protein
MVRCVVSLIRAISCSAAVAQPLDTNARTPKIKIRMVSPIRRQDGRHASETGGVFETLHRRAEIPAARWPSFTPPWRRAIGGAMLNHATGHTSACKPPFRAGAVVRVVT